MSELVRKEPIRFSWYVIQQIKDRNFDGLISIGLCGPDSLVLMSPDYYVRKPNQIYAHNWYANTNRPKNSWILEGWKTWFGTKKNIRLIRNNKNIPYTKDHQDEIDQLYDAFVDGIEYLKNYVEPTRKDEWSMEHEKQFWL